MRKEIEQYEKEVIAKIALEEQFQECQDKMAALETATETIRYVNHTLVSHWHGNDTFQVVIITIKFPQGLFKTRFKHTLCTKLNSIYVAFNTTQ